MGFYNMTDSSALISTGVKPVKVQTPSLDVLWNILLFLFLYVMFVFMYVCVCMCV